MWSIGLLFALLLAPDPAAEGMKALNEEKWEAAAASFRQAIAAESGNYAHHFHLAFAQSMLGQDADAIASYRKVLELQPGVYEAELNLGVLLLKTKQPGEAAPLLLHAAEQKPKEFRPAFYAADALLASGQAEKAAEQYRTALSLQPGSAEARAGLARALAKAGKLEEAAAEYKQAAAKDREILLELASLYETSGKKEEAAAIYREFPDNPAARERAGELLLEAGKASDAIPQLEDAVAKSPTPANRYALATAYNLQKDYPKAEEQFRLALEGEPNNVELRANYARTLRAQRKYLPAAQEFARVVQARPESAAAWSDLAGMLILTNNDEQALAALDRVRALGGETPAHFYFRALLLDRHKVYKEALDAYEKFLGMSEGKFPDEEFKARQRVRIIKKELEKR